METVQEYLPLALGSGIAVLFVIGLGLALRTEGGRQALAGGAVKFALAALALAERWLGSVISAQGQGRAARVREARGLLRRDAE
jgi:hypothetical protein